MRARSLITGAGFGQGRSHAVRLAEEGADIVAVDLAAPYDAAAHPQYAAATAADLEETKSLVEKTGRRCVTAVADVRDLAALRAAAAVGLAEFGHINSGWSSLPATFTPGPVTGDGRLPEGDFGLAPPER